MTDCVEELSTRHYLGRWYGFGPVLDSEHVVYAILPTTSRNGNKLTAASFTANLNNRTQSLARVRYVTKGTFDYYIARNAPVDGTARAHVAGLRRLRADIETPAGTLNVRAICVIDLVEPDDCDGHATMGFSEAISGVSQKQIGKKRQAIRMDLASTFSEIKPLENHDWPWRATIIPKRFVSICRAFALSLFAKQGGSVRSVRA